MSADVAAGISEACAIDAGFPFRELTRAVSKRGGGVGGITLVLIEDHFPIDQHRYARGGIER